jgi:hypothetical protein
MKTKEKESRPIQSAEVHSQADAKTEPSIVPAPLKIGESPENLRGRRERFERRSGGKD